jgi:hypothetical protein
MLFCDNDLALSEPQYLSFDKTLGTSGPISGFHHAGIDDLTEQRHNNTSVSFLVQLAASERDRIDKRVENGDELQQFFFGGPTEIISNKERFGVFRELGLDL